jgi:hypothetical protein
MQLQEIKQRVDLHDLAERLGLERPHADGNYRSPHKKDTNPSLSIYESGGELKWKDHGANLGGDCFDLVEYVTRVDNTEAIKRIREMYNLPYDRSPQPRQELSTIEYIAQQCLRETDPAIEYLCDQRGIDAEVVKRAIKRRSVGFSTWTSAKQKPGELGYGGAAVAFICKDVITSQVMGVDYRYLDPALNGDLKTKSQGEKSGVVWTSCLHTLKRSHTVVVCESAINALSVETAVEKTGVMKGWAALAIRGTANHDIDWSPLIGKRVIVCMDNDAVIQAGPRKDESPGRMAAWRVVDQLTALNIPALIVDQADWEEINDLNDLLRDSDATTVRTSLEKVEQWLIPGLPGDDTPGKKRVFLPSHDWAIYWKYRTRIDFTSIVKEQEGEDGEKITRHEDICGFRLAALSRITIASAQATMTGEPDIQSRVVFAASVQIPRHGNNLLRRVLEDDNLHNLGSWSKFGPVFRPQQFSRMLAIWERATDIGARKAANFVGLCYREGKPSLNEGPDCYFTEPDKQCPYHNLQFPTGAVGNAAKVIDAYQKTFSDNAATFLLLWALGGHMKAFLGFWPHMVLQAEKGSGKSTIVKRLERTIGFTMFSGQSLQTEFRLITSVAHTSHPVGWEELSARKTDVIDKAVALLQETYQFTITRRGSDMTEYLLSAPVLLAGEDVPVDSLLGKVVRTQLVGRRGELIPEGLPRFPVREWLQWLERLDVTRVREIYAATNARLLQRTAASQQDSGAMRMVGNYAALATAWRLLCEFADIPMDKGNLPDHLLAEMNGHVVESRASREPWVWILEIILGEIDREQFNAPYKFENIEGTMCLLLRPTHCMQHISQSPALRAKFDSLPVKSARVFNQQLQRAGVVFKNDIERTVRRTRIAHLQAISLDVLHEYGLSVAIPENENQGDFYG